MTGISESVGNEATAAAVKKAVGGWMIKNLVLATSSIFTPNHDNKRSDRTKRKQQRTVASSLWRNEAAHPRNVRKSFGMKKKESAVAAATTSKPSWKKIATIATLSSLGTVYVLYPTSLLLMFRVSEQISWIRLFQNFHSCRMGNMLSCLPVGMVQIWQLATSLGSFGYFYALWKGKTIAGISSLGKGLIVYALFWTIFVVNMKLFVDELALYRPPASDENFLQGKVAVITGANRGIGLATAQWMASKGAHVVLTCRTIAKCQPAVDEINRELRSTSGSSLGSASAAVLDLSSLESANALVETISNKFPGGIHYLFCNAGTTPQYSLTNEGLEDGFGGMHLAHMAVTLGLLPLLKEGAKTSPRVHSHRHRSRIVMVSSEMSINAAIGVFGPLSTMFDRNNLRGEVTRGDGTLATSMPAYGRAKLCNVLLALELNRQLQQNDWPVIAHAVHTGAVVTDSSRNSIRKMFEGILPGLAWLVGNVYFPLLWRNVHGGARTLLCAALSEEDHVIRGGQYLDSLCHAFLPSSTNERDLSAEVIIPVPLGGGKMLEINLDAVQGLLLADAKYSSFLWDVSMEILQNSPARNATMWA